MILGRLLEAAVLPGTFFLAWHAWGTLPPLVSATVEQCKLDCAAEYTTSEIMNSSSWSMWDTQRLVGPTKPSVELNATYPHAKAPFPLPFYSFCQLGCSYFFSASPQNTTCKGLCDDVYARNVSVGISDYAEKARLECRDGCDIAVLRCQSGYSCVDGVMSKCAAGTYRNTSYEMVTSCLQVESNRNPVLVCPKGTYREGEKGRGVQDCDLCPVNTYQNVTAATAKIDCIRCPDGLYAELEGTAECSCITADSCIPEWQNYQRNSVPFVGRM